MRERTLGAMAVTGRYADVRLSGRALLTHRLFWLRHRLGALLRLVQAARRDPRDNGAGHVLHREWGRWTLRPATGWRSWRYISPAPHSTRAVPAADADGASDWALDQLGM